MTRIRAANAQDAEAWLSLRYAMWPDGNQEEHRSEIDASPEAHCAVGFQDARLIQCFRKDL